MEVAVTSGIEKEWTPTKKQQELIALPFSIFEALYGGSAGSGKSEILIVLPLIYGFHEHPLFKGLILRRTFPELESEIILRSKEWYPSVGGVYNESKRQWTFPSGAIIKFGHADKEQDVRKYDTAQYNYIAWDESTSFTGFQYEYLSMSRARSRTSDLPAIVRSATNPGNVGHTYFRTRFVDPNKNGGVILRDVKTGKKRVFIQARITDNPHILKANPTYIQQLESLPEAEKRAKLLGDWYTYLGQVFSEWRLEPLTDEPDIARHVIQPFDIPNWWPRVVGIDWGFKAYTWIGLAALSPKGRVFLYKEYAEREKRTAEWINDFINLAGEDIPQIKSIRICHSASQQRGEMQTILSQLQKACNVNHFKCGVGLGEKARIEGKLLIHEYLRWKPKPDIQQFLEPYDAEFANMLFRNKGTKAYENYVNSYKPQEPEVNLPKLQVFDTCQKLINTIPDCIYDEIKTEDVKEFDGDDPYDGLRILLSGVKEYLIKDATGIEEMKKVEAAIADTTDITSLYRKLEFYESKNRKLSTTRRRRFSMSRMRRH
jgi:terminase large subunit-like protein